MAPRKGGSKTKNPVKSNSAKSKKGASVSGEKEAENLKRVPVGLQQLLLNIFRDSFPATIGSDISTTLQEIKQHLYNRDFQKAFGQKEYLEAYAVRWSPSRALCYAEIFKDILPLIDGACDDSENGGTIAITCLGGGAGAEIVGLAAIVKNLSDLVNEGQDAEPQGERCKSMYVRTIDIADWSAIINSLVSGITTPPPLSAYASASAKASNAALVEAPQFTVSAMQADLLSMDASELQKALSGASLVTLMFTLNELYTTSIPLAQKFLANLTAAVQPGTLLLVADSPGSYSTVTLNGKEKKYPMHWLLDHTLLKAGKEKRSDTDQDSEQQGVTSESKSTESTSERAWEKLKTCESIWFRLPEGLKYPIPLENMRYQLHLYRKI
ncbi:hypothetical protein NA57DRAFT_70989 [Rhizodiscina lignyota]|uniref:25S rRNA (Uridine(2843)-N(3))-methyltransferase n=1 Tax=Rhizodiscina lignyota TaxID=1504668 RepID=A0A9P4ISY8_9PEZI|nr:hypothetical protein NA57DRAFT_70989 [Rhizodiscina lignyota]